MHPVYLAPAMPPAKRPANSACFLVPAFPVWRRTMTVVHVRNPIQMSGDPEEEICQKTTGVRRKSTVIAVTVKHDAQREAKQATDKAVRIPPRNIDPNANFSLPRARPKRIRRWPCPHKKLCEIEK